MKNAEVLSMLAARGISATTAENFRLGWCPGEEGKDIWRSRSAWGLPDIRKDDGKLKALWLPVGLVIPHVVDGIIFRLRIRRPEGEPRYYVVPGSSMSTMVIESTRRAFVIVEAELDGIAVASQNRLAGAVALGSASAKPDAEACQVLQGALQILNALDYGDIGGGAKAVGRAVQWWKEHFNRCDRWPVPQGKDPGEAFRMGTDLEQWIKAGLPPVLTIATGDKQPAPPQEKRVFNRPPSPLVLELLELLRKNPAVRIIHGKNRFAVLRNEKYVGGRIAELIFRVPDVNDYISNHPDEEINSENLII